MPRVLDVSAHASRRERFLEAAARLIVIKGYQRMTVQDVLDDVQQSKGAFYHYFDSKQALFEALINGESDRIIEAWQRLVETPGLPALKKLRRLFQAGNRLKLERKGLGLALLPMWLSDENAVIRQRILFRTRERVIPLLSQIIAEGIEEGVFVTRYPDYVGRVVFAVVQEINEALTRLVVVAQQSGVPDRVRVEQIVAACHEVLERILGARSGALELFDVAQLMDWFDRSGEHVEVEQISVLA